MAATEADVRAAYRLLLGREADPDGLAHHLALVREGDVSTTDLAYLFFRSDEFVSRVGRVAGGVGRARVHRPRRKGAVHGRRGTAASCLQAGALGNVTVMFRGQTG